MADGLEKILSDPGSIVRLFKQGEAVDAVLKLISEADVDVTESRPDGTSALHSFAILGCYEIVKLLWEKGARPTILKVDDSTILHSVVRAQDDTQDETRADILKFFLSSDECGGNSMPLDHRNSKGWTALKLAARKNLEKCVEVLVECGADPDVADHEQYTALHNAIGNPDIVKLLLTKSKNIDKQNQDGETALYIASERGLTDSALILLEYGANPNIPNKEGIAPLFLAARGGHMELVKALTRKGADVNCLGASQGIGALHWAAHKEHEDIAVFLIESGGDVLLQDKEGRTPLSMAAPELVEKMIAAARKVNPEMVLPDNSPPMSAEEKAMTACCGGNVQALQALLQSGVSVNHASGSTTATLLHMAAYCGQLPVLIFLMRMGVDWKAVDKDGDTVLHFACMKEVSHGMHDKTLEFLMTTSFATLKNTQNVRGDTPIMVATRCQFVNRVKILLRFQVDVTLANHKKELPLHRACSSDNNIEVLLYFTEMSPDINAQDTDGWSPLMYAAKAEASATVKYLLQRGADPNITQTMGFTALYLAAQEDNASICRLLLKAGADPLQAGGPQKLTPLHIAAHRGSRAVCLVLIEHGGDIYLEDTDNDTPLELAGSAELKQAMMSELFYMSYTSRQAAGGGPNEPAMPDNQKVQSNKNVSSSNESLDDEPKGLLQKQDTFSKEQEREDYTELVEKVQSQSKQLAELERELESLQGDKEMLLSRNKCLEEELQEQREVVVMSHRVQKMMGVAMLDSDSTHSHTHNHHNQWWAVDASEYEITGKQLNVTKYVTGRFFDVYPGRYRCMPVVVKQVRNVDQWSKEVFHVFLREVEVISHLQCPFVVQFLGASINCQQKACTILSEFMVRRSLDLVLHVEKIPLDWNTRLKIVKNVCCGMAYLHSHQILHRSLIPRNILIGEHFNAKISDFGLFETKKQSEFFTKLCAQCIQLYKAPEAIERLEFTTSADVYSFGIIMCEAATGQKPFADLQLSPIVMVMKLLTGLRPSFNGGVPQEYQKVAEKCWHGDPNLRPAFKSVQIELSKL